MASVQESQKVVRTAAPFLKAHSRLGPPSTPANPVVTRPQSPAKCTHCTWVALPTRCRAADRQRSSGADHPVESETIVHAKR